MLDFAELARAGHIWRVRTIHGAAAPPTLALMHVTVDYDLCEGHGQCLGLWIVQQIAEAMGGRVDFAARDGGGLVATFRAPIG